MRVIICALEEFKYNFLKRFDIENKCDKCEMCITEKISYEYDEYDSYCLMGKDIYEEEYCFIPLFILKIKSKLFKEKIMQEHQNSILEGYADMVDYFAHQEDTKRDM